MKSTMELMDLDQCVRSLHKLSECPSGNSPKTSRELYVAAINFLAHLKEDQNTLSTTRSATSDTEDQDDVDFPTPEQIPAILAVVHDQQLFKALISCLTSSPTSTSSADDADNNNKQTANRKRTYSFSESNDNGPLAKISKMSSPMPSKRGIMQSIGSSNGKPAFNARILAATILYIGLEPFDHWPVPLVRAYAEDCFGARVWVDDPCCQALVSNLALCHNELSLAEAIPDSAIDCIEDASKVANFYEKDEDEEEKEGQNENPLVAMLTVEGSGIASTSISPRPDKGRATISKQDSSEQIIPVTKDGKHKLTPHRRASENSDSNSVAKDSGSGDGDDDDEQEVASKPLPDKSQDDGNSSSSGEEEEEEVILTKRSIDEIGPGATRPTKIAKTNSPAAPFKVSYPVSPKQIKLPSVRQRFFGQNLEFAHVAIASSLSQRLDQKSKQNSSLLQTLPAFTPIPHIRKFVTAHLEKWLQSPALAGLARNLFSQTVKDLKTSDPPRAADVDTIKNILSMRLKANQLNAHVDNITTIALANPNRDVSIQIYLHLLRAMLEHPGADATMTHDKLKMIAAIYGAFPQPISSEGIASSLLTILSEPSVYVPQIEPRNLRNRVKQLIRNVSEKLSASFDTYSLLVALRKFKPTNIERTIVADAESKARLMFQCCTLLASPLVDSADGKTVDGGANMPVSEKLSKARKIVLDWCCMDYGPLHSKASDGLGGGAKTGQHDAVGAGIPEYSSILDGMERKKVPPWFDFMRCMLFMEHPDSDTMRTFMAIASPDDEAKNHWQVDKSSILSLVENGTDLDDESMWIVIKSVKLGKMSSKWAFHLMEHLFHCCRSNQRSNLKLTDPELLMELYTLAEYVPPRELMKRPRREKLEQRSANAQDGAVVSDESTSDGGRYEDVNGDDKDDPILPRLAYPGMWWRATTMALTMCGASPEKIGVKAWNDYPTLRTLAKMITSDRYRFPTVDCDEKARDDMKTAEQTMRDREASITEKLFFPKKPKPKITKESASQSFRSGSRVSRRQREKRERVLKKEHEKKAADAREEEISRRKKLRVAQKSLMLWDPHGSPRKPPRESADLIFSINDLFGLARTFQLCESPDYILTTIGGTSRGAIERAYDWLIPIISVLPETISRLPASASCFLLLRAYGTEGEERAQLQSLAKPLLIHVRHSLMGEFGDADAVRAFDLLLSDVASHKPNRRRCARRVLTDAIGKQEHFKPEIASQITESLWMTNILHVDHASLVVNDAVNYMSMAAKFERGSTLKALIFSLSKHIDYAKENDILKDKHFSHILVHLISARPGVCAEAMTTFGDLKSLAVTTIHNEFVKAVNAEETEDDPEAVSITLCHAPNQDKSQAPDVILSLGLLQSACVLLSIPSERVAGSSNPDTGVSSTLNDLVNMLLQPPEMKGDKTCGVRGLASATLLSSEKIAIPVESWVMLARSASDFVARRAALAAPDGFLPRLLLCSGLPSGSFTTMIDRLGELGNESDDEAKTFNQLLVPSASSQWDIGRLGKRRVVSRRLLGRITAYIDMHDLTNLKEDGTSPNSFLSWLRELCKDSTKPRKAKAKKLKLSADSFLKHVGALDHLSQTLQDTSFPIKQDDNGSNLDESGSDMIIFFGMKEAPRLDHTNVDEIKTMHGALSLAMESGDHAKLDGMLIAFIKNRDKRLLQPQDKTPAPITDESIAAKILLQYSDLSRKPQGLGSCIVKWIPVLTQNSGSEELWKILFSRQISSISPVWNSLLSNCICQWSQSHIVGCRDWILRKGSFDDLGLERSIRFLVKISLAHSPHTDNMTPSNQGPKWGSSKLLATLGIKMALACVRELQHPTPFFRALDRNNVPDPIMLILLIAGCGRAQARSACEQIMAEMSDSENELRDILLAIVLRIYASFPMSLNLADARLRSVLKEGVAKFANTWIKWRSPMDDSLSGMLEALAASKSFTSLGHALHDHAKKHPLLLFRKAHVIVNTLYADAFPDVMVDEQQRAMPQQLRHLQVHDANVRGRNVKLAVMHWGHTFTASLWLGLLQILSAVPHEVLFVCGLKMGLPAFLEVYLSLIFVQSELRPSDELTKVKSKYSEFLSLFKASNPKGWQAWISSKPSDFRSLGKIRNVLLSCNFMTQEEAIASMKEQNSPAMMQANDSVMLVE